MAKGVEGEDPALPLIIDTRMDTRLDTKDGANVIKPFFVAFLLEFGLKNYLDPMLQNFFSSKIYKCPS